MMLRAKNIWVAGGDPRQAALAELLADDGHSIHTYALERGEGMACEPSMAGADRADCVVLPLPAADPDGRLNAPLAAEGQGRRGKFWMPCAPASWCAPEWWGKRWNAWPGRGNWSCGTISPGRSWR